LTTNDYGVFSPLKVFDKDNKGYLTHDELRAAMTTRGQPMTDEEVEEMIAEADADNDGHIDYKGNTDFSPFKERRKRQKNLNSVFKWPNDSFSSIQWTLSVQQEIFLPAFSHPLLEFLLREFFSAKKSKFSI
jgi:hypothetical protein